MLPPPTVKVAQRGRANGCQIGRDILPKLDQANRAWALEALAIDSDWSITVIADHLTAALASDGVTYSVDRMAVSRHREQRCTCIKAGLV